MKTLKIFGLLVMMTFGCQSSDCGNGQQDGNETGIDCGGDCSPCTSIQNVSGQIKKISVYSISQPSAIMVYDFIYSGGVLDSVNRVQNGVVAYVYNISNDKVQRMYSTQNQTDIRFYYSNNSIDSCEYLHGGYTIYYGYSLDTIYITRSDLTSSGKLFPIGNNQYNYDNTNNASDLTITTNSYSGFSLFELWSWTQPLLPFDVVSVQTNSSIFNYNINYSQNGYILSITVDGEEYVFEYY